MNSIDGAISTEPVWCSARSLPGSAVKFGSSARARLILTTPLLVFQCLMSLAKSDGRLCSPTWSRKAVRGCSVLTMVPALISSPLPSATPTARPFSTRTRLTGALSLTSTPKPRAAASIASDTAPMPPSAKPQLPRCPSPTSPIEWCAITYAVPGSYGPAQVPITPLTASAPLTWDDSNQSSSRSAIDMVISRVASAMVRTSRPRCRQASRSVPARSRGLREPMFGGTVSSIGPSTSARPATHASQRGIASASFFDHCATDSKFRLASSAKSLIEPPSGNAW